MRAPEETHTWIFSESHHLLKKQQTKIVAYIRTFIYCQHMCNGYFNYLLVIILTLHSRTWTIFNYVHQGYPCIDVSVYSLNDELCKGK